VESAISQPSQPLQRALDYPELRRHRQQARLPFKPGKNSRLIDA